MTATLASVVIRVRPHVVITTGAAPGYVAIRLAKLLGARTMFIDSVANARELSLSAKLAEGHADRLLTQWPSVATSTGADYAGSVF
jgi:UDP-N-acetylglucosamine:LPS N-acetylglucosamine transferase